MRKIQQTLTSILLLCVVFFSALKSNAQTTLQQGDVSIIGWGTNVSPSDDRSIGLLTWVPLSTGTVIKFTTNTFRSNTVGSTANNNANSSGGQAMSFTVTSPISPGSVIKIVGILNTSGLTPTVTCTSGSGTVALAASGTGGNGTSFALSSAGRAIFIYQGSDWDATATSATFFGNLLFGLTYQGSGGTQNWLTSGSASTSRSYKPADLPTTGSFGNLALDGFVTFARWGYYSGATNGFGSISDAKNAVNNAANWTSNTSSSTIANTSFISGFTVPNTSPSFTSAVNTLSVCKNSTATSINSLLTISDFDAGQTETWSVSSAPTRGTLSGFNAFASSGSSVTPTGLNYTPTSGYSGTDAFTIAVSDGYGGFTTKTITVTVKATSTSSTPVTVCNTALPYTWNGTAYSTAGTYTKTFTNAVGCDSVASLVLTVYTTTLGNALAFDGSDYVATTSTLGISGTGSFTLEAWVKTTATTAGAIIAKRKASSNGNFFGLIINGSGKPYFEINESSSANYTIITGNTSVNDGAWHHIAAVRTATQILIYVDGISDATAVTILGNPNLNTTTFCTLGTLVDNAGTGFFALYNGSMDEVRLWNTVRSQTDLQANMNNELVGNETGLTAYYNFNQGTANASNTGVTTLLDRTANNRNGTLTNFTLSGNTSNWVTNSKIFASTTNATICSSALPYSWNGLTFTTAGIRTASLTNANGCDSVATLVLTVKATSTSTTNTTICSSALPYSWNGSRASAGTYTYTTTNAQGCDSVATLVLTVKATSTSTTNTTICSSQLPYSWNGNRASAGTYTFTTNNSQGCDSVATLNLTVNTSPTIYTISNQTVCAGSNSTAIDFTGTAFGYTWTNSNIAIGLAANGTGNIASFVATNTTNAPITATITVTPNAQALASYPLLTNISDATGSFGDVILQGNPTAPATPSTGNSLCANGIYLNGGTGGQDIQTPNIASLNSTNFTISVDFRAASFNTPIIVGGSGWRWIGIYTDASGKIGMMWNDNNFSYSTTTINLNQWYNAKLTFSNNTANLYLDGVLVNTTITNTLTTANNLNFTTTHFGTGSTINGCIKNLNIYNNPVCLGTPNSFTITVKATSTSTTNTTICANQLPYSWNGSRASAGTYTYTTTNSVGCDSVATLTLTVNNNPTASITSSVTATSGIANISTLAGSGAQGNSNGTGTAASFKSPAAVATDAAGNVYVADRYNHLIRKITTTGVVSTLAGNGTVGNNDGIGTAASFNYPTGLAIDAIGNIYVADGGNLVRKIDVNNFVSTFAGSGVAGSTDGTGTAATFNYPYGIATDAAGNVYVACYGDHLIRKITAGGVVSTFAGSGVAGSTDGYATAPSFNHPISLNVDAVGNIYVADQSNQSIRKITAAGVVSTLAGNSDFNFPNSVATDAANNVYVADLFNNLIRKITPAGIVSTIAGSGSQGNSNGIGSVASFYQQQVIYMFQNKAII